MKDDCSPDLKLISDYLFLEASILHIIIGPFAALRQVTLLKGYIRVSVCLQNTERHFKIIQLQSSY